MENPGHFWVEINNTDVEALAELARTEIYDTLDPETYGVN